MIKDRILKLAKENGIEKAAFAENAFVALFPYFVEGESGNVSMYARGEDYHLVAERKLRIIAGEMLALGATKAEIHVDKGVLNDRMAAFQAGLGFFGKNGMLICEKYGSWFFIGQIVHDLCIERDYPLEKQCIGCGECIRKCVGQALGDNKVDVEKCVSHISQKKGELLPHEEKLIRKTGLCWGCDTCQTVCPHNRGLKTTAMPEFAEKRLPSLEISDLEGLSNKEFKQKYGNYAFSWRGKNVLLRNLETLSCAEGKNNEEK